MFLFLKAFYSVVIRLAKTGEFVMSENIFYKLTPDIKLATHFELEKLPNDEYIIKNTALKKVWDNPRGNYNSKLISYAHHGGVNQRWTLTPKHEGIFIIKNLNKTISYNPSDGYLYVNDNSGKDSFFIDEEGSGKDNFKFFDPLYLFFGNIAQRAAYFVDFFRWNIKRFS